MAKFSLSDMLRQRNAAQNARRGYGQQQQQWAKDRQDQADADYVKSNGQHPYVKAQRARGLGRG